MENQSIIDPASGSFFPALIALIMLCAGIVTIFQDRSSTQKKAAKTTEQENESNEAAAAETFTKKDYKLILTYFCLVIGFVILLPILTFFPAAFLFLAASMFYLKGISWLLNVTVSLATIVVIYFLFSQLFNIVFP